jgi:uncharacterized protein YbjQ (UPF0145 family)
MELAIFLILVTAGYFVGRRREASHYKSILRREKASQRMPIMTLKTVPENWNVSKAALVTGIAVISTDYFKMVTASIKNVFGGRLTTYESLLDRARREAVLRMKTEALKMGANVVMNVRFETSSISGAKASGRNSYVRSVEIIASGTALKTV